MHLMSTHSNHAILGSSSVAGGVATRASVVAGIGLALLLLWKASVVFMLLFIAILFAVLFQGLADALQRWVPGPYWARLAAVLTITIAAVGAAAYFRALAVSEQIAALREELPRSIATIRADLHQYEWGRQLLDLLPDWQTLTGEAVSRSKAVFATTLSVFGYLLFVLFTFLFVAFEPRLYRRGIELLAPPRGRARTSEVLDKIWQTLWWWLAARGAAMLFVGVTTTIGLTILDVPLALTLGLIAALLDFVPNFGPIVAAVPAILRAPVDGLHDALLVATFTSQCRCSRATL